MSLLEVFHKRFVLHFFDLSVVLQREGFFLSVFLGKNETQKSPWFVATKRAQVTPLGRHALPRLPLIYQ